MRTRSRPSAPLPALSTSYPRAVSARVTKLTILGSSSMTRTFDTPASGADRSIMRPPGGAFHRRMTSFLHLRYPPRAAALPLVPSTERTQAGGDERGDMRRTAERRDMRNKSILLGLPGRLALLA